VLTQVGVFAGACQAARSLHEPSTTHDSVPPPGQETSGPQVAETLFVASKNSMVFHRVGCRWAGNISDLNRVTYKTRQEAIADGKRPCKSCNP